MSYIKRFVHSAVEIGIKDTKILIDPGKYCFRGGHPEAKWVPNDFTPDLLLLSHIHSDHFVPEIIAEIYQKSRPQVLCTKDVANVLGGVRVDATPFPVGSTKIYGDIKIQSVYADHKRPGLECIGFVIDDGKKKIYHCGDTHYMKEKPYADIVLPPIGDLGYTMGPSGAAIFVKEIKPKVAIPIHYESPKMDVRPETFRKCLENSGIEVRILKPGETFYIRHTLLS